MSRCSLILAGGAATVLLLAAILPAMAGSNPLPNPGFESAANGQATGWDGTGNWSFPVLRPHQGKRSAVLDADSARAGNKLVSQCYLFVKQGATVTASAFCRSEAGGADVGVEFCDELGGHLKWSESESVGPTPEWTLIKRDFPITDELWKQGVRSVRVFVQVVRDRADAAFDDVSLTSDQTDDSGGFCKLPRIDPGKLLNLLPNPDLKAEGDAVSGWEPLAGEGASCDATGAPEGKPALRVHPGDTAADSAGWQTKRIPIDLALPYRAEACVRTAGLTGGSMTMRLCLLDANGNSVLCSMCTPPIGGDAAHSRWTLETPGIYRMPTPGYAELRFAVSPGAKGTAWVDDVHLTAIPMNLSIRAVPTGNVFQMGKEVRFFVLAPSNLDRIARPSVHIKTLDFWGNTVQYERREMVISPHAAAFYPVLPKIKRSGHYTLLIRMIEKGTELASATAGFAVMPAPDLTPLPEASHFGMVATDANDEVLDLAREANCKWARIDCSWERLGSPDGQPDFTRVDRLLRLLKQRGMVPIVSVGGAPTWASGAAAGADAAALAQSWEAFCNRVASHLSGQVPCYEVVSGVTGASTDAEAGQDAQLLAAAYRGLHKGDPACKVVVTPAGDDAPAYAKLLAAGAGDSLDIVGVRVGCADSGGEDRLAGIRQVVAQGNQGTKPLWDTTQPNATPMSGDSAAAVATHVVRDAVRALADGCERISGLTAMPYYDTRVSAYSAASLLNQDHTVRPAWVAYQTLAATIGQAKFVKWLEACDGVKCAVFEADGAQTAVVWTDQGKTTVSLATDALDAEAGDIMGDRHPVLIKQGKVKLEAREDPQFVVVRGTLSAG